MWLLSGVCYCSVEPVIALWSEWLFGGVSDSSVLSVFAKLSHWFMIRIQNCSVGHQIAQWIFWVFSMIRNRSVGSGIAQWDQEIAYKYQELFNRIRNYSLRSKIALQREITEQHSKLSIGTACVCIMWNKKMKKKLLQTYNSIFLSTF